MPHALVWTDGAAAGGGGGFSSFAVAAAANVGVAVVVDGGFDEIGDYCFYYHYCCY